MKGRKKPRQSDQLYLFPEMLPIHFQLYQQLFFHAGYRVEFLQGSGRCVLEEGLKYVHNDTCYPALVVIGQVISALKSGDYDLEHTAIVFPQTGGGCRASNYLSLLRKALDLAGFQQVKTLSLNALGINPEESIHLSIPLVRKIVIASVYGDLLMLLKNQRAPYEQEKGSTMALVKTWCQKICTLFAENRGLSLGECRGYLKEIVADFRELPCVDEERIKVGIVGEIYVKYYQAANHYLEAFLEEQHCEVCVPGILPFFFCCVEDHMVEIDLYGGSGVKRKLVQWLLSYLLKFEEQMIVVLQGSGFHPPVSYERLKELVVPYVSTGCNMGEGWVLTAELLELIQSGYNNIVCAQPFGCLPNHIVGKGMGRKIKTQHPKANITYIDYDPGASAINHENRIRLMLSLAKEVG